MSGRYKHVSSIQLGILLSRCSIRKNAPMPVEKLTPERRRQLTRETLLDSAEQVFAQKGVNGASMEEIAAEAGFTRGAIYSNFGSKEELLLAVMERFIDRQYKAFTEFTPGDDPRAAAASAADLFMRNYSLEVVPLSLELRLNALRSPEARTRLAEADRRESDRMARLIKEQLGDSGLPVPARDLADIGRGAVLGLMQYAAVDEERSRRYEQLIKSLFVLLAGAIGSPGSSEQRAQGRQRSGA